MVGARYRCDQCEHLTELRRLRRTASADASGLGTSIDALAEAQRRGLADLSDSITEGMTEIASALEWGFEAVRWELAQQTETLRAISETLSTPAQTQASRSSLASGLWRPRPDSKPPAGDLALTPRPRRASMPIDGSTY